MEDRYDRTGVGANSNMLVVFLFTAIIITNIKCMSIMYSSMQLNSSETDVL